MLPEELKGAYSVVAKNYAWSWSSQARLLFERLPTSQNREHPLAAVERMTSADWAGLAGEAETVAAASRVSGEIAALKADPTSTPEVAYFSPEFGIADVLAQYSGGLGILAGDHLKAASDMGLALCGVGLFYREGFFRQEIARQSQREHYERQDPERLGATDTGIVITVPLFGRDVAACVWRFNVGRVPLILLDTDIDANTESDRRITDRLYSGDRQHRLAQEVVLGVGGMRALAALGWNVPVLHLNEGHAGFLILELLDREVRTGATLDEAVRAVRPRLVFTTHTPVPAGIDRFEKALIAPLLKFWADRWNVPVETVSAFGHDPDDERDQFNMAALCLRFAGRTNGVSELHGKVSRELFASIPGGTEIGSITNGVHARTWVMPAAQEAFDKVLGPGWTHGDKAAWERIEDLDDDTVRSLRCAGIGLLDAQTRARAGFRLDPGALTIGFARRFATYKRATLLLRELDRLCALLGNDERPVQFVFAGKAHPADTEGKQLLHDIVRFSQSPASQQRFVFTPGYDIAVAKAMYAGCDVWLNNPIRPHEACGTSGEKSALNGGLNFSISDGWWDEMADGRNGWTIESSDGPDPEARDDAEAAAILDLLENQIVPEFFDGGQPCSKLWIVRMRHGWRTLGPQVTAGRMVTDYERRLYRPALCEARRP
ncbi:MAG: alpha-glucan family phosphorylase [Acidimicrobiaceae bacterium]|nr:alpha-glucan family phosphorylase [Acidimicrobiia bacterium]MCY4495435.1 alpha-glucan family phosphorylase [Acidimicrobiaceae bacterium]